MHNTLTSLAVQQQQSQTAHNQSTRTAQLTLRSSSLDRATHPSSMLDAVEFPPLSMSGAHGNFNDMATASSSLADRTKTQFSDLAAQLESSGGIPWVSSKATVSSTMKARGGTTDTNLQMLRSTQKVITGAAGHNAHLKVVNTTRSIDIFVSRLHRITTDNEIIESVKSVEGISNVCEINLTKLKSKLGDLYSSFYVEIRGSADSMKRALDVYMNAEAWPSGVFVKRYFKSKNG